MADLSAEEFEQALDDYWNAKTPEAVRKAYLRLIEVGLRPAYGEEEDYEEDYDDA